MLFIIVYVLVLGLFRVGLISKVKVGAVWMFLGNHMVAIETEG